VPIPPALSGSTAVRVRYCECDPMNVAHHAAYIPWLEIGRTELLRTSGISYAQLEKEDVFLVVVKLDVRYRRPILYDDVVEVRTRVKAGEAGEPKSRVKIQHEYDLVVIDRGGEKVDLPTAAASTTLACVGKDGKVRALPEWLMVGS
jgi:acyl-CoA thioester hydrolase